MNTVPRCPICDFKAMTMTNREHAIVLALDLGAKRGLDGVKAVLCKGHLDAWESNVVNGTTHMVAMIAKEAELANA